MFTLNDDLSIYATRGDIVFFSVSAMEDGSPYKFQAGDVVRIKVFGKKDAESVVLQKDFPVTEETEKVEIFLSEEDTKIGEVISKPKDYWYEVELNPYNNPQTIIGYDEDGAKVFKLFPEGDDIPEFVPDPEDIRVMDDELDMTSTRPVQNQAVARAVVSLRADFGETKAYISKKSNDTAQATAKAQDDIAVERARIDNFVSGATAADSEVVDVRVGADGKRYESAGTAVREQIGKLVDDVQGAFFERMLTPKDFVDNVAIDKEGVPTTNEETIVNSTCVIPVQKGMCVSVIGEHINRLCLYDQNDMVIPGSIMTNDTKGKTTTVYQDGFLRFTIVCREGYALHQPKEDVKIRIKQMHNNNLVTPRIFGSQYLYEPGYNIVFTENSAVNATGEIINNNKYDLTDFIPVEPLDVLSVYYAPPATGAFYDENKNFVGAIESGVDEITALTFKVPYNAVYARFNVKKDLAAKYSVVYGEEAKEIPESGIVSPWFMPRKAVSASADKWAGAIFCTLGDSITWQDGKAYGQGDVGAIARGYQTIIKEKLAFSAYGNYGVSGAPVANGSKNGAGTVTTAQTVDYANYDLCIIAGGTNDFKLNVPIGDIAVLDDTTFYGAYRKTVEYILTQKPTIRLCLFTPLHRNNSGYDITKVNTAGHKLIDYVNAIKSIGEMYSLPVCDVYANSGINAFNLSIYTMDGLHPNDEGYARMGGYCAAFLETI